MFRLMFSLFFMLFFLSTCEAAKFRRSCSSGSKDLADQFSSLQSTFASIPEGDDEVSDLDDDSPVVSIGYIVDVKGRVITDRNEMLAAVLGEIARLNEIQKDEGVYIASLRSEITSPMACCMRLLYKWFGRGTDLAVLLRNFEDNQSEITNKLVSLNALKILLEDNVDEEKID